MKGTAFRYIFIVSLAFLLFGVGHVLAQGPPDHLGKICITCHQKYSENTAITKFSPCGKKVCHSSNPTNKWGARGSHNRYPLHLQKEICTNCHRAKDGRFEIHPIHTKFEELGLNRTPVECRICHWSPEGYNSSLVQVPAYGDRYIAGSTLVNTSIKIPPWGNDCGYCHPSTKGAMRLHDVHEPVIEKACQECHGGIIESRPDLVEKVTLEVVQGPAPMSEKNSSIVQIFSDLFEEMARYILKIMS